MGYLYPTGIFFSVPTRWPRPGWAPDPLMVGIRSPDGLVVGLAPATLEFWVRFPNERNQGKQAHPLLKYRVPQGSHRTRSPSSRHPPFTHYPFPLRSLVCGGQPSPHKPRLVVSHSTCPPLSSSPHAHSFVLGTTVINTHTLAPPWVGSRSPDGWDQIPRWAGGWACTSHPGVLGSIPKREEPGKTGAPSVKVPGSSRVPGLSSAVMARRRKRRRPGGHTTALGSGGRRAPFSTDTASHTYCSLARLPPTHPFVECPFSNGIFRSNGAPASLPPASSSLTHARIVGVPILQRHFQVQWRARLPPPRVLLPHTCTQDGWFLQPKRRPARLPRRTVPSNCICRCSRMRARLPPPRVLLPHTCTQDGWFLQPKRRPARLPRRTVPSNCICRCSRMCARLPPPCVLLPHTCTQDGWFLQPKRRPARLPRRTLPSNCICRCSRMRARLPPPRVLLPHTCTQDGWFLQPKRRPARLPRRTVPSNCICRCSRMRARLPPPRVLLPHTCTQDGWFLYPKRRPARLPRRTVPSNCICRCSRMRARLPLHILLLHTQVSR
jgi:hypothetical protein